MSPWRVVSPRRFCCCCCRRLRACSSRRCGPRLSRWRCLSSTTPRRAPLSSPCPTATRCSMRPTFSHVLALSHSLSGTCSTRSSLRTTASVLRCQSSKTLLKRTQTRTRIHRFLPNLINVNTEDMICSHVGSKRQKSFDRSCRQQSMRKILRLLSGRKKNSNN